MNYSPFEDPQAYHDSVAGRPPRRTCAWEVSDEDVRNVLHRMGMPPTSGYEVHDTLGMLDTDAIEAAALQGDTQEDQTEYAYREMERQLEELL